jgi:apolipoprotein N-acyltransferase
MSALLLSACRVLAALALSAVAVYTAASSTPALPWLIWVAFAPWLACLPALRTPAAMVSGLLMGLAWVIPVQWPTFAAAVVSAGTVDHLQFATTLAFFLTYALPFALFAGIDGPLRRRWPLGPVLNALRQAALLASLICLCWAPFPYTPAVGLVAWPSMLQLAPFGGEPLLLTLLLWPSAVLASIWNSALRWPQRLQPALMVGATLLAVQLFGSWRMAAMDRAEAAGEGLRLSALPLQLDLPMMVSPVALTRDRPGTPMSALELSRDGLARSPRCELLVWPETPVSIADSQSVCARGRSFADSLGLPLLMQCYRPAGEQVQVSAEFLRPGTERVQWHGKSSLVPYYEEPLTGSGPSTPGAPGSVFALDDRRRLIPTLCYELHARPHLRAAALAGGNIIVHMASFTPFARHPIDVWDQAMARLRAVEFGMPILRAANRAPVGWIDANGRERALSARFGRHAECLDLWSPAAAPTLYARLSPVAAGLPGALMLLLTVIVRRRRRDSITPLAPSPQAARKPF